MSDGANFSPSPPLANLWALIYTKLNLYTLIMLSCSLAHFLSLSLSLPLQTHTHPRRSFVWFTIQRADTCSCCLSTSGGKKVQEHSEGLRKCVTLNSMTYLHITLEHSTVCEARQVTVIRSGSIVEQLLLMPRSDYTISAQ